MRKVTGFLAVVALLVLIQTVFPGTAQVVIDLLAGPDKAAAPRNATPERPKRADKNAPGFPHVNFTEGRFAVGNVEQAGVPPIAAGAADFDSDGVQDLVTSDANGKLSFFKGNADAIYPNTAEAKAHREVSGEPAPFSVVATETFLGVKPDLFAAGDFNADGYSDILAASRGDNVMVLVAGNGKGGFSGPQKIGVSGRITTLATGEIGRIDGQTDVAVGVQNKKGSFLLVYEHPEGAFRHDPEAFVLPSAATDIAIGQLDNDPYSDLAAACGNDLTVVHGRGQAYPLDLKADLDIKRPTAVVQARHLPFSVVALVIGNFGQERGDSLAMLSESGSVKLLKRSERIASKRRLAPGDIRKAARNAFVPVDADARQFGAIKHDQILNEKQAEQNGLLMMDTDKQKAGLSEYMAEKIRMDNEKFEKLPSDERSRFLNEKADKGIETRQRRKTAFEQNLAGQPSDISQFQLETLSTDNRLASTAAGSGAKKLIAARASDSSHDDMIVADAVSRQIQVIYQSGSDRGRTKLRGQAADIVSLPTETAPTMIVPMRLNSDNLSDLVVLGEGSAVPTVLETLSSLTLVVNTTDNDSGGNCDGASTCSLRRAIFLANSNPGLDTITFNIPGGGVQTIHPTSALPDVTGQVVIDGTTQPGFAGTPLIEIEGDLLTGASEGLKVMAGSSVIRGLAINHIPSSIDDDTSSQIGGSGITVLSTSSFPDVHYVIIEGNFLGTDPTGESRKSNDANGVHIFDADRITVGGTTPQARNVLSGNGNYAQQKTGVGLAITGGNENVIEGNYIGLDASGVVKLGNSYGVFFTGINNQFGGDAAGAGNVISGNGGPLNQYNQCFGNGISVYALISTEDGSLLTNSDNFKGNLIGTTANGEAALGNCTTGITSNADVNTSIGSITESGRNVISDNGWDAIWCRYTSLPFDQQSGMCTISGNNIGTDKAGNTAIANDERNNSCVGFCFITDTVWVHPGDLDLVVVGSPGGTTPGGACTGLCNLISGNDHPDNFGGGGLMRTGFGLALVVNNYFGTNRAGTAALPNRSGSWCFFGSTIFGAELGDENGGLISGGNLASGNKGAGFTLTAKEVGGIFEVTGNLVGMSSDGNNPIPNGVGNSGGAGMNVSTDPGVEATIGGTDQLQKNVIGATTDDGFTGGDGLSLATYGTTRVINNWIGLNKFGAPLPNTGNGISVTGTGSTLIGGVGGNENNVIFGNGEAGVFAFQVVGGFSNVVTRNVTIRGNIIANNGGLGIDLGNYTTFPIQPNGVTENDCQDADTGANELQNYPILFSPTFNADGTVSIDGFLGSEPLRHYTIDFYANNAADPSNYGEGANLIGTTHVTTGGFGSAVFDFTSAGPVSSSSVITATATSENGSTSEFSSAAGACTRGSATKEQLMTQTEATCPVLKIVVNDTGDQDQDPNTAGVVCNVDPNAVPGTEKCTLRAAIEEAITRSGQGRWMIEFSIPASGVQIISPATALPTLTKSMGIDATTQPGYAPGAPLIEVTGFNAGPGVDGLHLTSQLITIQGMVINGFSGNGILIDGGGRNTVAGCFIGVLPTGLVGVGNKGDGIKILNSSSNQVGDTDAARRNIISANGDAVANTGNGITITGTNAVLNKILGNYIGTDVLGDAALGNRNAGVYVSSDHTQVGASHNVEGVVRSVGAHNLQSGGNLISGNVSNGISIIGAVGFKVEGNLIGTDHTGSVAIPNQNGVFVKDSDPDVGEPTFIQDSLISGNNANGILIVNSNGVHANGNNIGTVDSTVAPLGNDNGVLITDGSHDNLIGGEERESYCIFSDSPYQQCHISVISGNRHAGVLIEQESGAAPYGNYVTSSWIGTDINGILRISNETGVSIRNSQHNTVYANRISGNTTGISISGASGGNNRITTNRIGTEEGIEPLGNTNGVVISSSGNRLAFVERDRIVDGQVGNNISGNIASGVVIRRNGSDPAPTGNTLQSNCIGTAPPECERSMPNATGVLISDGAHDNHIGIDTAADPQNVISGNSGAGIAIEPGPAGQNDPPFHNFVNGNFIGLVIEDFPLKLPNQVGVRIHNSQQNMIRENVVSGNIISGIEVGGANGGANDIVLNHIGTNYQDSVNTLDLGNGRGIVISSSGNFISLNTVFKNSVAGIILQGDGVNPPPSVNSVILNTIGDERNSNGIGVLITNGASNNFIGEIGHGNTISGNTAEGVSIQNVPGGTPSGNNVIGNRIGTDVSGRHSIPNLGISGVRVEDSDHNHIDNNLISGNTNGIYILGQLSAQNLVRGNCIGLQVDCTSPLGNIESGILIGTAAHNNSIGGPNEGDGNTIAHNKKGVVMPDAGCCNMIDPNLIFANTIIGIDLNNSGAPIPNDPGDGDDGPNNLQNYPEIVGHQIDASGDLIVSFKVDSLPGNSNYGASGLRVEFFKADIFGQGAAFVGFDNYTEAEAGGTKTINLGNASALGVSSTDLITGTATDADGNTSEFFPVVAAAPTAAGVTVSGQVLSPNGRGLGGALVSMVDSRGVSRAVATATSGYYRFEDVPTGRTYVIGVTSRRYQYASRAIQVFGALDNVDFVPME